MRVASEQASGEKYRSMGASLAVWLRSPSLVDFYTVSHNINRVKEFFAKWYKKDKSRRAAKPDAVAPKRRGRPRAYQPEIALGKALDLFRKDGFAATSLDDLSAATGMNRPSLYGAFGDKRELYIKSYQRYRADARAAMIDIFRDELPIRERLERIYAVALDIYLSGEAGPRGCFTVMTAASEAVADPEIRKPWCWKAFPNSTRRSRPASASPRKTANCRRRPIREVLAQLASATIHTIAIRARAQVPRKELEAIVKGAIDVMAPANA